MQKTNSMTAENFGGVSRFIKGLIVSFIITFACIILFAFLIKWFDFSDKIISPVNLGIKALSVGFGTLIFARKSSKGILKGVLFALIYTLIAFLLFSALAGVFNFSFGLVLDLLFTALVGAIFGIFGVNIKS